jgi:transposase
MYIGFPEKDEGNRMDVLHQRCAGLDVHKDVIYVCVLVGSSRNGDRFKFKFKTFPSDLIALRTKLLEFNVTHVIMESTGVYWMPIYDTLEGCVELVVANAQHVMNVPGRKTDESDAEWLAKLLRFGLVNPSFVPRREIRELRQLTRYERALIQTHASEQNRVEKQLQIAGIKLSSVASKVLTVSGSNMVEAIGRGVTDPSTLADLALGKLRKKIPQLEAAFAGNISPNTQHMLALHSEQLKRLDCTIAQTELRIAEKALPYQREIDLIDSMPGINRRTAIAIIAETGPDMSPWDKSTKFAAMSGLCPGNYISAGKRLKNRSRHGNPHLKAIMVQAACSAINTDGSYYQAKYKHLKARRGHKRALVAIAHAMIVAIYYMLKTGTPHRDPGPLRTPETNPNHDKDRAIALLSRLGYSVSAPSA